MDKFIIESGKKRYVATAFETEMFCNGCGKFTRVQNKPYSDDLYCVVCGDKIDTSDTT